MIDISQSKINLSCPKCNSKSRISLKQAERQEVINCTSCGTDIKLVDKGGSVKKATKVVNHSLKQLRNTIKRFGK